MSASPIERPLWKAVLLASLLAGMVLVAYAPALRAGFIWDDDDYVTENPLLHESDGFERIWFSMDAPSQYFPLVYTAFRIEYGLWGLDPFGYHLVNVLFHIANALLLWRLLWRLEVPGAWLAAAVFALHPVHVESVAWITERKNVMSLFFSLASLLAWHRFIEARAGDSRRHYLASLGFYTLALASKVTACTLPAAQLLVLWLRGHPITRQRVSEVLPFFGLGVAMGIVVTYWERHHIGTLGERFELSLVESFLIATRAIWFYLGKLLWPSDLAFSYPKFEIDPRDPFQYSWAIAGALLLWFLWRARSAIGRAPLAAAIFFVATLSPLIGFIPLFTFWYTYVADHYQYMASIGPIALLCGLASHWLRDDRSVGARGLALAAAALLIALSVLVWKQSRIYESEETLWIDTLAVNPTSWMAQTNLGRHLLRERRFEEAADAYGRVFAIRPDVHRAHVGRARALVELGREREAEQHFEAALELRPDLYGAHQGIARIAWKRGDYAVAIAHYEAMIAIAPEKPTGHYLMGRALQALGRPRRALVHLRDALAVDPEHSGAREAIDEIESRRAGALGAGSDAERATSR